MSARNPHPRNGARCCRVVAVAFLALVSARAERARADDTASLTELLNAPVVTTASHKAEAASTAPATSTTIGAAELRRYGLRTLQEAIDFLGLGVSSAGGRAGDGTSDLGARGVVLRGDGGNHFLLLLDGHALNEPFFGSARFDRLAGIPIEMIDHLEIIVGPGSVLYGSNAMLGVVNVVTKSPETLEGGHVVAESTLVTDGRGLVMAGIPFRAFGSKAGLAAGAEYLEHFGPELQLGPQDLTGSGAGLTSAGTTWGGTIRRSNFARVPSGLVRLKVGNTEIGVNGKIAEWGVPQGDGDFDQPDTRTIERALSVGLVHRTLLTRRLELMARAFGASADRQERFVTTRFCVYEGVTTCDFTELSGSRWLRGEMQASYDWLGDAKLSTLAGVEGRVHQVNAVTHYTDHFTGDAVGPSVGVVDRSGGILGAYVQQTWTPIRQLGLNAGARIDHDPRFDPVVSPRAAASFEVWRGGTVRGIYSEAFRSPSFHETDDYSELRPRALKLDPERVRSFEASFEQRAHAQRVLFGAFYTRWKDLVELHAMTEEETRAASREGRLSFVLPGLLYEEYRNVAEIHSYGFNAVFDGSAMDNALRYGLSATGAYTRRRAAGLGPADDPSDREDEPLPLAPAFTGNARISYDLGRPLPTVALASYVFSARASSRGLAGRFDPTPYGPQQLALRLTITGALPFLPGLSYRLIGNFLVGGHGPYVIGPTQTATSAQRSAELDPLDPVRITIGLQYDAFGP